MNTLPEPRMDVDVIVPLYNMERYIGETLRSVLWQTVPPRTLIVVDDGSTDKGAAIAREILDRHKGPTRCEVLHRPNAGLSAARNAGVEHGKAPFVAFLDADDLWEPTKLEKQLTLFGSDAELALVYCGYATMDDQGRDLVEAIETAPELRGRIFRRLLMANRISGSGSAVLVRRSVLEQLGGFDPSLKAAEDWDMWLRIAEHHVVDHVAEPLVRIRRHAQSMQTDTLRMLRSYVALFAKWFEKARKHPEVMKQWGHLIAEFTHHSNDRQAALDAVRKGFTPEQRSILFRRTGGSLPLYLALKRISAFLRGTA